MNRLWVWISIVIIGVVLIVALFPFAYREISRSFGFSDRPAIEKSPGQPPPEVRLDIERRIWIGFARTIVVGSLLALVAGILLTRWLIAPLQRMEKGADEIAQGQFSYRVPVKGSAEMQSVAESFNHMAEQLERQEELRRDMLADVSHELRHPVHVLLGSQQAILDGVYPLSMQEINRLLEQTRNLSSLVDDLHELAQAEARELSLHMQKTNLSELLYYTTEAYRPLALSASIELNSDIPASPVYALVDAARVRQVIQNLLVNAIRYTSEGGSINASLTIIGKDIVKISIRDSGIGIKPENIDSIFDRFYREDGGRERALPGSGLGLAISKALVEAHGGRIEVHSPGVDLGSTFTVFMPVLIAPGEELNGYNVSTGGNES